MSIKSKITDLQPDYVIGGGADTNSPAEGDTMAGVLSGFFRSDYSIVRSESVNKGWERWLGILTPGAPSPNAPTYVSATQYTVPGNWTAAGTYYPAIAMLNRRIKATVTAGTVYGYISVAAFAGGVTTVTCVWDSGALDSGLTEIQYGIAANNVPAGVLTQSSVPDYCVITNGGAGAAFTGSLVPAITAYTVGKTYKFNWTQASQGSDTIALNGLAAVTIRKLVNGALVNLALNDIPAGACTEHIYTGTVMQIVNAVLPAGILYQLRAYKASDQSVTSSTVLVNDADLKFAIAANEAWQFELDIYATFDAAANSGLKTALTVPAGCALQWSEVHNPAVVITASGTATVLSTGGTGTTGALLSKLIGQVVNGATPGTVQLQWAQQTSDASATIVKTGSSLVATRLNP